MGEKVEKPTGLDWVQLEEDMNKVGGGARFEGLNIFYRKFQENPLIPAGIILTTGALTYGLISFYRGQKQMQQNMMRLRVGAQFFTVLAACVGIFLTLPKEKRTLRDFVNSGKNRKE